MKEQYNYMQKAFELAQRGKGSTSPNPMVAAVIVKNGRIIAEGFHKRCGGDHAEVDAFKKAGLNAKGATLYVTLEPCSHVGRTPPCTDAIIKAGIKKVVIGVLDPNPVNHGKSIKILRHAGIEVESGFLKEELTLMNKVFNKYITKCLPYTVAKCAQTLDGKIATATGDSKWITSQEARDYAREKRGEFDAIMVGINTVLKDDPQLNSTRKDKNLKKIIVDSSLKTPINARLFASGVGDVIVVTTAKASKKKIQQFKDKGVCLWEAPAKGEHVDLVWLFKKLAKNEIAHVLIEGGGRLIGRALKDGLVDAMMIYIAPKIIGDQGAISSIAGLNVHKVNRALELRNMMVKNIGQDLLIEGEVYVHRNR
ncbi:MAG: bifunctional diaminohydroxyphosphoribosylaminopyrimidine deaminase/5-amino-6-(5-phosphoribosylamino)uracil reductase RibD [Candidatus Omnitrophota bacterium]